jgi:superfamily I DNA/RNA helicase
MEASPQQSKIYQWVEKGAGNGIVEAVAGSGKTTTLIEAVRRMKGSVAFLAYNKKIAVEIESRLQKVQTFARVRAGTFHSFGFGAVMKALPGTKMDDKKMSKIAAGMEIPEELQAFALQCVSLAKQSAIGVVTSFEDDAAWQRIVDHYDVDDMLLSNPFKREELSEAEIDRRVQSGLVWAKKLLQKSVDCDKVGFDFDDMIYAPLVHDMKMWQNQWVLIDEAQDTNPARRAFAKKILAPGGRLLAVGDPRQAIYGFTGADNDSLDIIAREFGATRLPLTVSYRCSKAVVAQAQTLVDHIQAAPTAPEGRFGMITMGEFVQEHASLGPFDAVLCRNTKPLVELAFILIQKGIGCHVEGKDIGRGLVALCKRWKKAVTISDLIERLEDHLERQTERFLAKGQEMKAESLSDRIETIKVIASGLTDDAPLGDLVARINNLFEDTEPGSPARHVTLSTAHKSKGREWERVFLFGRNKYMPSPFARQAWQMDQEMNLQYVAITRAKLTLLEVLV